MLVYVAKKNRLANMIKFKDLEIEKSSWIIQKGPKSHDKYPDRETDTERQHHIGRGGGNVTTEAETGVMWPQTEEA